SSGTAAISSAPSAEGPLNETLTSSIAAGGGQFGSRASIDTKASVWSACSSNSGIIRSTSRMVRPSKNFSNHISEVFGRKRFAKARAHALAFQTIEPFGVWVGRNYDDGNLTHRRICHDVLGHFDPTHRGHVKIGQDQVNFIGSQDVQGSLTVGRLKPLADGDVRHRKGPLDELPNQGRVIDDQHIAIFTGHSCLTPVLVFRNTVPSNTLTYIVLGTEPPTSSASMSMLCCQRNFRMAAWFRDPMLKSWVSLSIRAAPARMTLILRRCAPCFSICPSNCSIPVSAYIRGRSRARAGSCTEDGSW